MTTLIIDDTPANIEALTLHFEQISQGNIISCSNLEQGLMAIAQHPEISKIFLDLKLPGMKKAEAVEKVSARLAEVGNTQAIVFAMSMYTELQKEAIGNGASMVLNTRQLADPNSNYLSLLLAIAENTSRLNKVELESGEVLKKVGSIDTKISGKWFLVQIIWVNPIVVTLIVFFVSINEPLLKLIYQLFKKALGL